MMFAIRMTVMDKDKHINMLEGTLTDTERVLFDPLLETALRHYVRVKAGTAHACRDLLYKRTLLLEGRKRRPGVQR